MARRRPGLRHVCRPGQSVRGVPVEGSSLQGCTPAGLPACRGHNTNQLAGLGHRGARQRQAARLGPFRTLAQAQPSHPRHTCVQVSMMDGRLFDTLEAVARRVRGSAAPFGGIQASRFAASWQPGSKPLWRTRERAVDGHGRPAVCYKGPTGCLILCTTKQRLLQSHQLLCAASLRISCCRPTPLESPVPLPAAHPVGGLPPAASCSKGGVTGDGCSC